MGRDLIWGKHISGERYYFAGREINSGERCDLRGENISGERYYSAGKEIISVEK